MHLAPDKMGIVGIWDKGEPLCFFRRRLIKIFPDAGKELAPNFFIRLAKVYELIFKQWQWGGVFEFAITKQGYDELGPISLKLRPFRFLPTRRQNGKDDATRFAACLNFSVPFASGIEAGFVEPDRETFTNQSIIELAG